jgi:hypothetical protein
MRQKCVAQNSSEYNMASAPRMDVHGIEHMTGLRAIDFHHAQRKRALDW